MISKKIIEHAQAYQNLGLEVPPYRITCKEHKEIYDSCKNFMVKRHFDGNKFIEEQVVSPSMISEYCGVRLEIVMIVDPYL